MQCHIEISGSARVHIQLLQNCAGNHPYQQWLQT